MPSLQIGATCHTSVRCDHSPSYPEPSEKPTTINCTWQSRLLDSVLSMAELCSEGTWE